MYVNGEPFEDRLTVQAGADVEQLSFRIMDENDSPIDFDDEWRSVKHASVVVSWWTAPKKKKQPIAKDFKLPSITNVGLFMNCLDSFLKFVIRFPPMLARTVVRWTSRFSTKPTTCALTSWWCLRILSSGRS